MSLSIKLFDESTNSEVPRTLQSKFSELQKMAASTDGVAKRGLKRGRERDASGIKKLKDENASPHVTTSPKKAPPSPPKAKEYPSPRREHVAARAAAFALMPEKVPSFDLEEAATPSPSDIEVDSPSGDSSSCGSEPKSPLSLLGKIEDQTVHSPLSLLGLPLQSERGFLPKPFGLPLPDQSVFVARPHDLPVPDHKLKPFGFPLPHQSGFDARPHGFPVQDHKSKSFGLPLLDPRAFEPKPCGLPVPDQRGFQSVLGVSFSNQSAFDTPSPLFEPPSPVYTPKRPLPLPQALSQIGTPLSQRRIPLSPLKVPPTPVRKDLNRVVLFKHIKEVAFALELHDEAERQGTPNPVVVLKSQPFQLIPLTGGQFKNPYKVRGVTQITPKLRNDQVLLKVYNESVLYETPGRTREYTELALYQYRMLVSKKLPVAQILNDPREDGYFLCELIVQAGKTPRELSREYCVVETFAEINLLSQEAQNYLQALKTFLEAGVELDLPIDLSSDNFIIDQNGRVVLIDFYENADGYRGAIVKGKEEFDGDPLFVLKSGLKQCSRGSLTIYNYLISGVKEKAEAYSKAKKELLTAKDPSEISRLQALIRFNRVYAEALEVLSL